MHAKPSTSAAMKNTLFLRDWWWSGTPFECLMRVKMHLRMIHLLARPVNSSFCINLTSWRVKSFAGLKMMKRFFMVCEIDEDKIGVKCVYYGVKLTVKEWFVDWIFMRILWIFRFSWYCSFFLWYFSFLPLIFFNYPLLHPTTITKLLPKTTKTSFILSPLSISIKTKIPPSAMRCKM
jgi:hypothetical protein